MKMDMNEIVALAKQYGFIYQGSEIYNGLANTWDYGPLGVELKNNIKQLWWKEFIQKSPYNVGLDSSILMNSDIWKASGHIGGFSDPLVDCKECKSRHRADKLIEDFTKGDVVSDGWNNDELLKYLIDNNIGCPNCGVLNFSDIRNFDLMFKTNMGVLENDAATIYMRPETAQGIFVNFKNIARTTRKKIPFGVGQIGKSFRNEITPGNFIFRTREFEQMELEFFCEPGTEIEWFDYYQGQIIDFLNKIQLDQKLYRIREHEETELSHYSNKTADIEFKYPFGWGELWGLSSRTDFDLMAHEKGSKQDLKYHDPVTNNKYIPYVIEPSVGVDRLLLALLCSAYTKEEMQDGEVREVLKISPLLAPIKVAILPLVKKLSPKATEVYSILANDFNVDFDETGTIGKRYRRQDVIGTPWCLTFDYDSLEDDAVTIRHRDTMDQERIKINELCGYFQNKLKE
ncbi:MAG: glycine--tRNA ligase [Spiroplasma sp.]|nr:glycine--tRNA ligase [Mycoplasmatales bacterium]